MPEHIPEGEVLVGLAGTKKWTLGSSIGVGGFGEIYSGRETGVFKEIPLAIKIEPHENGPLFVEMNFYLRAASLESGTAVVTQLTLCAQILSTMEIITLLFFRLSIN